MAKIHGIRSLKELFSAACAIGYLWRHLYPSNNPWALFEKIEPAMELGVLGTIKKTMVDTEGLTG